MLRVPGCQARAALDFRPIDFGFLDLGGFDLGVFVLPSLPHSLPQSGDVLLKIGLTGFPL